VGKHGIATTLQLGFYLCAIVLVSFVSILCIACLSLCSPQVAVMINVGGTSECSFSIWFFGTNHFF
jgi:hypothetical protein